MKVLLIATALFAAFAGTEGTCVDDTAAIFISTINNGPDANAPFASSFLCAFSEADIDLHGNSAAISTFLQTLIDTFGDIFTSPASQSPSQIEENVNSHWSSFETLVDVVTGGHLAQFASSPITQDFLGQVVPWRDQLLAWAQSPSTFAANAQGGAIIYEDLVSEFVAGLKAFNDGSCVDATAQIFINTINNGANSAEAAAFPGSFICAFDQYEIQWSGTPQNVASWFATLIGTFGEMFTDSDQKTKVEITDLIDAHWSSFESSIDEVTGGHLADYVTSPVSQDFLGQVVPWKNQLLLWAEEPSTFAANAQTNGTIYNDLVSKYVVSLQAFLA